MLEEQARELEGKGEERVEDEQKRNADLLTRIERIKNLEIENYVIRYMNASMQTAQWCHECLNSGSLETSLNEITTHKSFVKVKSHLATSAFKFPDISMLGK